MSDFGSIAYAPVDVNYMTSVVSMLSFGGLGVMSYPASATYVSANRALFVPFRVIKPTIIAKMFTLNGATVGTNNIDVGIYDRDGVRLASNGGTLSAGANSYQIFTMSASVRVSPEQYYYMAVVMNGTTDTLYRGAYGTAAIYKALGMAEMASAYPLPATATLATISSVWLPMFGFIFEEQ